VTVPVGVEAAVKVERRPGRSRWHERLLPWPTPSSFWDLQSCHLVEHHPDELVMCSSWSGDLLVKLGWEPVALADVAAMYKDGVK